MPRVDFVRMNMYRRMRYRFVAPDFQSDLDFAVHDMPGVIEHCAGRLASGAEDDETLRDFTRTPERTMLVFEAIPNPQGTA